MSTETSLSTPQPAPGASQVQCSYCGQVTTYEPEHPICDYCGTGLSLESDRAIMKNPRLGKGMQGVGIFLFIFFLFTFFFLSRWIGWNGMGISLLIYLWGFHKSYRNKLNTQAAFKQHEHKG